jgi:HEAT repeat protein
MSTARRGARRSLLIGGPLLGVLFLVGAYCLWLWGHGPAGNGRPVRPTRKGNRRTGPESPPAKPDLAELLEGLRRGSASERLKAASEIGELGAGAAEAIPDLARAMTGGDAGVRSAAAGALGRVGPACDVEMVHTATHLTYEEVHRRLRPPRLEVGAGSGRTEKILLKLLEDRDRDVRRGAAYLLWRGGKAPSGPSPQFLGALGDDDPGVAKYAALALSKTEAGARAALPALEKLLGAKVSSVRTAAAIALLRAGGDEKRALKVLTEEVRSGDWHSGLLAPRAIAGIGSAGETAVRAMLQRFENQDRLHCNAITLALVAMGQRARKVAVPAMETYAGQKCAYFRCDVGYALWRLTGKPDKAVPVLVRVLEFDRRDIPRRAAAAALAEMGPAAREAVPALERVVKEDGRDEVLAEASRALEKIRGKSR